MKNSIKLLFLLVAAALSPGCASGPVFSEVSKSFVAPKPDEGRIFVYRTSALGAAVQPSVMLNGKDVGSAVPHGFFYVDRPGGSYEISTSTEVKRSASFVLDPGQTRYIRLNISMGFFVGHVWPELMEPKAGEAEIQKCHFIGTANR